jgi:hypothetical protein
LELELEAMGTAAADNHDQAPLLQAQPEEILSRELVKIFLIWVFIFLFFSMAIISSLMGNYILIYV